MKVFSAKFGGMLHPAMIESKQSVKVFSAKFSLSTDPRKFSLSKVYCHCIPTCVYKNVHNIIQENWHYKLATQLFTSDEWIFTNLML